MGETLSFRKAIRRGEKKKRIATLPRGIGSCGVTHRAKRTWEGRQAGCYVMFMKLQTRRLADSLPRTTQRPNYVSVARTPVLKEDEEPAVADETRLSRVLGSRREKRNPCRRRSRAFPDAILDNGLSRYDVFVPRTCNLGVARRTVETAVSSGRRAGLPRNTMAFT